MVDSTPTDAGPPSTIRSMRPSRSSITCCGGGRRDMAGAVGGGRHHRPAEAGSGCRARPDAPARAPRCCRARRSQARRPGSRRASAAPASAAPARTPRRAARPSASNTARRLRRGEIGHMRDQRIERRPALGGIEPRDGLAVGGVGAEPIDGLGRKRDQAALGKAERRVGDGDEIGGSKAGVDLAASFLFSLRRLRACAARRPRLRSDFFFAASTLIQSRLRSLSMFCSRSNSRAIAVAVAVPWSAAGISRASRRGRAAVPAFP